MNEDTDNVNRRGISVASLAYERIGFAFREQETSDFGIDAHIEFRAGSRGSGDLIAMQIKSGSSYFREATEEGWCFRTDHTHAKYWLRHVLPVIVVIVDIEHEKVFWEEVHDRTVAFTESGAKILIPKDHLVGAGSIPALRKLLWPEREFGPPAAACERYRVFLGPGVSGREGWQAFAGVIINQLREMECLGDWDILITVRTSFENENVAEINEYGEGGEDLASIRIDSDRRVLTFSVSAQNVEDADLEFMSDEAAVEVDADTIIQHLMAWEGFLEDEP